MSIKQSVFVFAAALAANLFGAAPDAADLPAVKKAFEAGEILMLDVRGKDEWDQGHVKGALLIPVQQITAGDAAALQSLPRDKPIYTYCAIGKRSKTAAEALEKAGYKVKSLKAGFKQLGDAGFPTEK